MKILKKNLQIAIDGPVAAGKGTVSKLLAKRLGILYVDTGAMYRALTVFAKNQNLKLDNEEAISQSLKNHNPKVSLVKTDDPINSIQVFLDNKDITNQIRTEEISRGVSIITQYKDIRDYMVLKQQNLAESTSVVMEGRDITTRVLPNADLKIYLDADENLRANRRLKQLQERGDQNLDLEIIKKDLHERDYRDSHREIDPLIIAPDAWVLDTSNQSIEEVIDSICDKLVEKGFLNL